MSIAPHPLIAIVGAGALGSYYGARLAQHGHDVHFLLRSDFSAVQRIGLTITSHCGNFSLPPSSLHIYHDPKTMPPADLVIVTLKTTANHLFEPLIRPLLKPGTLILTLQNGLGNEQELASLFPAHPILGGVAFVCINRLAPGVIDHSAYGLIRIGEFDQQAAIQSTSITPHLARVVEIFQTSNIECEALSNLRHVRWEKLIWNIPFNGLSAALDQTTDCLLTTPQGEILVRQLMQEVVAAATADGITLSLELIEANIRKTRSMGPYYTSSHLDRRNHRPLELETLFVRPLRIAQSANIPTPNLQMLYHLLCIISRPSGS